MLTVLVDARCLQYPEYRDRGIGHFTRSLLRHARDRDRGPIELMGIADHCLPELASADRQLFSRVLGPARAPHDVAIFVQPSPMIHPERGVIPLTRRRAVVRAAVVYDFIPYELPARYLPSLPRRIRYHADLALLRGYDLYFPISQYTEHRLVSLLGVRDDRICEIGAPIRQSLVDAARSARGQADGAHGFGDTPYFLAVAGDDWRKNIECAVAAFDLLARRVARAARLVVVGGYSRARQAQILANLPIGSASRERISFRDGLSDPELALLYAGAVATICPSRMEGFSLPVVEALACGSPVLASDCAAQVELIADPDALFSPEDAGRLSLLMERALESASGRRALWERQAAILPRFEECAVAGRFWSRLCEAHEVVARAGAPYAHRHRRPRLAFVSPYPPDASGVAHYTAVTLREIAAVAAVDLYTDAAQPSVDAGIRVAGPISSFPYLCRRYDRVVSVVGNSPFHTAIVDHVRELGGACIEHDSRLAQLYQRRLGLKGFALALARALGRPVSPREAEEILRHPNELATLFFDDVVFTADPFIVHSAVTVGNVESRYGIPAAYLPFCAQREFPDDELSAAGRESARARLEIAPGEVVIVSLGDVVREKAGAAAIQALERLRAQRVDAALYFVGALFPEARDLRSLARRTGLQAHVHFMSRRVGEREYRDYLMAADLAVQLRTHNLGAISAALMDAIAAGLPSVANADLAGALETPSYVRRVPDDLSPILIAEQLAELLSQARDRAWLSEERAAYLAKRSPRRYAEGLMAILGLDTPAQPDSSTRALRTI